jgi:hypothetical protein
MQRKATKKSRAEFDKLRFWGIHYKTIDRFGYDDEQSDQIPVIDDDEVALIHRNFNRTLNHDEVDPATIDPDKEDDFDDEDEEV